MAEKKVVAMANKEVADVQHVKPITLRDDITGKFYVLQFDRSSVKFAEARGFNINSLQSEGISMTAIEELFFYAFRMHHSEITRAETDKMIYDKLHGIPQPMLERLVELYATTLTTLIQTEDGAKNATMTAEY